MDRADRITDLHTRAQTLRPDIDFSKCKVPSGSSSIKCRRYNSRNLEDCPRGSPSVDEGWVIHCLASTLVANGYQIPAYVIAGPFPKRRDKILGFLVAANTTQVSFRSDYVIGSIDKAEQDAFIFNTPSKAEGAKPEDLKICTEAIDASINNVPRAAKECDEYGSKLNDREISLTMKHVAVQKALYECDTHKNVNQLCYSNATIDALRYALILEDDQYLPVTLQRQLVELIIQAPANVGIFMLDDSYSGTNGYFPPHHLASTTGPYTNSWEKGRSRTCGAYLLSETAIHTMFDNGHWIPQRRVIDHSFNYIIRKESILTHWAYPPISCHGSRSLEIHPHGRRDCHQCCENFYDVTKMEPNWKHMVLVDSSNQEVLSFR